MTTTKRTKIENPKATCHGHDGSRIAAGFEMNGARFHVWLDKDGKVEGNALYKNPPLGIAHGSAGYFSTVRLKADAKCNAPLIADMLSRIDVAAARAEWEANNRAEAAQRERDRLERLAKERLIKAAPALLASVQKFLKFGKDGGDTSWHSEGAQSFLYDMMVAAGEADGSRPA